MLVMCMFTLPSYSFHKSVLLYSSHSSPLSDLDLSRYTAHLYATSNAFLKGTERLRFQCCMFRLSMPCKDALFGTVAGECNSFHVPPLPLPEHTDHSSASHVLFSPLCLRLQLGLDLTCSSAYVHGVSTVFMTFLSSVCVRACVCVCVRDHLCCSHKSGLPRGEAIASLPAAYNYRGSFSVRAGSLLGNCH